MLDKIFGNLGAKAVSNNLNASQQNMFNKALQLSQTNDASELNIPGLDVNKLKLRGTIDDLENFEDKQGMIANLLSNPQFLNSVMAMIKQKLAA